jgi:Fe-S-cluster-containing dehydrogenase component
MKPLFNFSLACRACDDAKCVKACPEKALTQAEDPGLVIVNEKKCKGCDWCVQACDHGGITIQEDTGLAAVCTLCNGTPQCIEFCPEEALTLVSTDEEADKRFTDAIDNMATQSEKLTAAVKSKNWKPFLNDAESRSMIVAEKLEALNKKAQEKARH